MPGPRMLRVGLTGPSGAGKSTVARMLAARGIPVVDADRAAHELYRPGSLLVADLAREFGSDVLDPEGGIDRARLGGLVFAHPERLARLNAIVHPPLVRRVREELDALEAAGHRVGVVEAAVLLHWDPLAFLDLVVGVTAPRSVRRRRLIESGLSGEAAEARLDRQVDESELARRSRFLLLNDRGLDRLDRQVEALARQLARLAPGSETEEG